MESVARVLEGVMLKQVQVDHARHRCGGEHTGAGAPDVANDVAESRNINTGHRNIRRSGMTNRRQPHRGPG